MVNQDIEDDLKPDLVKPGNGIQKQEKRKRVQSANQARRKTKPLKLVEDDTAYLSAQYHGLLVDIDEDTSDSSS